MTQFGILFGIMAFISLMAFNNCSSGGFQVDVPAGLANSASSQCRAKIIASAKAEPLSDPSLCENSANYQCDLRRFREGVGHSSPREYQCLNIDSLGQACVAVSIYNFDTSEQLRNIAEEADAEEGGAYNRDEASCINTQITSRGIAVVQGEGASIQEALENTIESCRQRNHP